MDKKEIAALEEGLDLIDKALNLLSVVKGNPIINLIAMFFHVSTVSIKEIIEGQNK
jgi:hypothetical protein